MNDKLIELAIYCTTALIAVGIPVWYLKTYLARKNRASRNHDRSSKLGLTEPVTLHPKIDPNRCIGTEACIKACPEGEILGVINCKATLVSPTKCIGHGACAASCPVGAITLVFGTEKRGVELPVLKSNFETNVGGIYIAGELGGMGLIRNAVTQGWEAITYIHNSLKETNNLSDEDVFDVIIIGAGPAGLSASLKAMELNLKSACFEQDDIGGTLLTYPRRKIVMTQPMEIPLYGKVKVREMYKEELLELWEKIITQMGPSISLKEKVLSVEGKTGSFTVNTNKGSYLTKRILLTTGRRGTPRKLDIPGEKSHKVAYRLIEPEQYAGSQVLVVGGGDSAVEAALATSEQPGTEVILSYRKGTFSRIKDRNRMLIEKACSTGNLEVLFESNVKRIEEREVILDVKGKNTVIGNDYTLIFVGGEVPAQFLRQMGIKIQTKFGET